VPTVTIAGTDLRGVGPVIEVRIAVNESVETALRDAGAPVPAPLLVPAMIDTGASCTVIREGLAQQLGLQPTGVRTIHTASHSNVRCYEYLVRLLLPANILFETDVVEIPLKGQHIDCLMGRDILAQGILVYIGTDNRFTLSF
jgi:gag-polyprotein putative aspartyl protease